MPAQYTSEQISKKDTERWNKLLHSSLYPSYLQSITYEYSKEINNREISTFIFTKNGEDIAGAHYSVKHSKFNLLSTADILSGIVFKQEPTEELTSYILDHFIRFAKANNVAFMRITPLLPKIIAGKETNYWAPFNHVLQKRGFSIVEKGRHTYWIDLAKSEEELLENMNRQTRYRVRQGLRSAIKTTIHKEPDDKLMQSFWEHYKTIATEKKFDMYSEEKFKREIQTLMSAGIGELFVYTYQDTIVNFSFASNLSIASYMHGALNYQFKELAGCPSPGQLAQWKMITTVKAAGAKIYDMGFCPGPVPQKEHPAYKIWRFKYDFGGDHVEFLPVYGKKLNPITGRIFKYIKYR